MIFVWLLVLLAKGERHQRYSVASARCDLAVTQECTEACEAANCRDLSFTTVEEASSCLPQNCSIPLNTLAHWAFPACADEEKGIYAVHVSRDNSNLTQALYRSEESSLLEASDAWLTIIIEENDEHTILDAPALIAVTDRQIVGDAAFCEAPGMADQLFLAMTIVQQPRANTLAFSLKPLIQLGLASSLERRNTITILLEPQLHHFSRLQKVGSDMGLGAVELLVGS